MTACTEWQPAERIHHLADEGRKGMTTERQSAS